MSRRKRSHLSKADCLKTFREIAGRARRFGETSDPSMFMGTSSSGEGPMLPGEINVQILLEGGFGVAEDFFEAIRVPSGKKLPRKEPA